MSASAVVRNHQGIGEISIFQDLYKKGTFPTDIE